jgi:hypothetical protein
LTRFLHHFLLNETACFVQSGAVSSTIQKKKGKAQNGAVLNGTMGLLLPLDA